MNEETFLRLQRDAQALAEKTAKECDDHAKKVLSEEDFEGYRELVTMFSGTMAMFGMTGKMAVFYEALATINRIVANAEKGQAEWNAANPNDPA